MHVYAVSFDEEMLDALDIRAGISVMGSLDGYGFLVRPEIAETRFSKERAEAEAEAKKAADAANPTTPYTATGSESTETTSNEEESKSAKHTRFTGHVETDSTRFFRSTNDIEKEILKHLNLATGTRVKITIHIEATNPDGFNQNTEGILKENGRTLSFGSIEFE